VKNITKEEALLNKEIEVLTKFSISKKHRNLKKKREKEKNTHYQQQNNIILILKQQTKGFVFCFLPVKQAFHKVLLT
jgi:hypothetical protein